MISFIFEVDQRSINEFQAALDRYADTRANKSYHYCLNRSAKDVAAWAAGLTHRANYEQVKAAMMSLKEVVIFSKTGRTLKHPRNVWERSGAARILSVRMRKAGKDPRRIKDWDKTVKEFAARALKSINFMRSGWLKPFQDLSQIVHQSSGISMAAAFGRRDPEIPTKRPYPNPKLGEAIPCRGDDLLIVEIANQSVNPRDKNSWPKGLGKYGPIGLQMALEIKGKDMLLFVLNEEMKKRAKDNKLS